MTTSVLLVDDDPRLSEALSRGLQLHDFTVWTSRDVGSALELLEREQVDVIISDEQMPGPCGTELMVFARKRFPDAVRLILSGKKSAASARRATEGGVYRYLDKPCPVEEIVQIINEALLAKRGAPAASEQS